MEVVMWVLAVAVVTALLAASLGASVGWGFVVGAGLALAVSWAALR